MARKRRGRNEGAIYQRGDGLWTASVSLGYTDNGKRRRKVVYGQSKCEVQEKLKKLQNDTPGHSSDSKPMTMSKWLDQWLANIVKDRVEPKTYVRYEQVVRLQLKPHLGGVRLDRLEPLHVVQLLGSLGRSGVSTRGKQMARTVLHTALSDAIELNKITYNPVLKSKKTAKVKSEKKKMQVFNPEQAARFLIAAKKDRLYALYVLALDSGMRQGELFALKWSDIDFTNGYLIVQMSLEEIRGHHRLKETKSGNGRCIHLSDFTLDVLNDHRKRVLAEGNLRQDTPIFCDHQGGWLRKSNVMRRSFYPLLEAVNTKETRQAAKKKSIPMLLPNLRFHDLRHTCATLLLLAGENVKVVSERLGHSSVEITCDVYSHVLPSMQKAAAARMDTLLRGKTEGKETRKRQPRERRLA
jgi:integrase